MRIRPGTSRCRKSRSRTQQAQQKYDNDFAAAAVSGQAPPAAVHQSGEPAKKLNIAKGEWALKQSKAAQQAQKASAAAAQRAAVAGASGTSGPGSGNLNVGKSGVLGSTAVPYTAAPPAQPGPERCRHPDGAAEGRLQQQRSRGDHEAAQQLKKTSRSAEVGASVLRLGSFWNGGSRETRGRAVRVPQGTQRGATVDIPRGPGPAH